MIRMRIRIAAASLDAWPQRLVHWPDEVHSGPFAMFWGKLYRGHSSELWLNRVLRSAPSTTGTCQKTFWQNSWPGPSAEMCRGFCCVNFGGFCWGFSWRIFPGTFSHKNEVKKTGDKIRENKKNPAAQKYKSAKNPFSQKPTLKISERPRKRSQGFPGFLEFLRSTAWNIKAL